MANDLVYLSERDKIEDDMLKMVNKHSQKVRENKSVQEAYRRGRQDERRAMQVKAKNKRIKIFTFCMYALFTFVIVWFFASWLNVVMNNSDPETIKNIWDFNFFKVIF